MKTTKTLHDFEFDFEGREFSFDIDFTVNISSAKDDYPGAVGFYVNLEFFEVSEFKEWMDYDVINEIEDRKDVVKMATPKIEKWFQDNKHYFIDFY